MREENRVLLIDGSSILSTCFFGNIPKEYLKAKTEEDYNMVLPKLLQTADGLYTNGIYGFCKILKKIEANFKPEYVAVAWDLSRQTFRREMYSDYKAQRKPTRPELSQQFGHMQKLLDYIGICSIGSEGVEADDLIGSMASKYKGEEIVILTKDQDQLQLISDSVSVWLLTSKFDDIVVEYGTHTFVNKTYNGSALENKEYKTLVVYIGGANGANWWGSIFDDTLQYESDVEVQYEWYFKKNGE